MPDQSQVDDAVDELERRTEVRRSSDRVMLGILAGLVVSIFVGGVAWGSTRAEISQKVDKADFATFTSGYTRDRATDSLRQAFRDTVMVQMNRKLDKVLCERHEGSC